MKRTENNYFCEQCGNLIKIHDEGNKCFSVSCGSIVCMNIKFIVYRKNAEKYARNLAGF